MNNNVYQIVTDRIIAQMEQGIIPWNKPWHGSKNAAISRSTGRPYSLLNQFLLGRPGEYATFNQIKEAGGKVKKGEKASVVVFWKQIRITETEQTEDGFTATEKLIPVLKYYQVFNLDQCENIEPKHWHPENIEHLDPIGEAEEIVTGYIDRSGVKFTNDRLSDRAYYSPALDEVVVPMLDQYSDPAEYYSTTFHELTHSTGHVSRLARLVTGAAAAFGSQEYSKEELTAELGSCFLMNHCGINSNTTERNSAAYLQSWLRALKNDPRMIVSAAGKAEKAVNLIMGEA